MSECEQCAGIDISKIHRSTKSLFHPDPSDQEWVLKDSMDMSRSAQDGCAGCRFFLKVIESNMEGKLEDYIGRKESISIAAAYPNGHTYHIKSNCFEISPIEVIGPRYPEISLCLANTEHDWTYTPGESEPRRPIPAKPKTQERFNMALAWLEKCSTHEGCSNPTSTQLPRRLVKIGKDSDPDLCLYITQPQEQGKYLTLSHCWGSTVESELTKSSLETLQTAISFDWLPKNFQDAITITKMLGFQYLWIDALCIVQDDPEDWARESSRMACIYNNGTIMLSALAAPHGGQGMLLDRELPRSHRFGKDKEYVWQTNWHPFFAHALDKRAWTFQERMMAPRIIHFTEKKMLWECASIECDEDSGLGKGHGLWISNLTIQKAPFLQLANPRGPVATERKSLDSREIKNRLEAYYICVDEYSGRLLTKQADKLPAFSGIASTFHTHELGQYLAGLWEKDLSRGLAWEDMGTSESKDNQASEQREDDVYIAPSWSWASRPSRCQMGSAFRGSRSPTRMDDLDIYKRWAEQYEPRLVSYSYPTRTPDPYGQIWTAAIVLHGYCRPIAVHRSAKEASSLEDIPWVQFDGISKNLWLPWKFAAPNEYVHKSVDWPTENMDGQQVMTFLALQVSMEIQDQDTMGLKIVMLVLGAVDGTNYTYKRLGRLAVDLCSEELIPEKWDIRDIQLF